MTSVACEFCVDAGADFDWCRCCWRGLTPEELEAMEHVTERIKTDGAHSVTGCPRFCRAVCSYRAIIKQLETKGVL